MLDFWYIFKASIWPVTSFLFQSQDRVNMSVSQRRYKKMFELGENAHFLGKQAWQMIILIPYYISQGYHPHYKLQAEFSGDWCFF